MLPPRNLLDWDYWRILQGRGAAEPARGAVDHTVRFEGRSHDKAASRIDRRRGNWSASLVESRDGSITFSVNTAGMVGYYQAAPGGRPVRLELRLKPEDEPPTWPSWVPIEGRPIKQADGEQCVWSNADGGGGEIVIVSGSHETCVTADGIPLAIYSRHRVLYADFTATSIDRTLPPAAEFRPPARALQWRDWGIRLRR